MTNLDAALEKARQAKSLAEKATEGPWHSDEVSVYIGSEEDGESIFEDKHSCTVDREFIAASRELVPELASIIEELAEQIAELRSDAIFIECTDPNHEERDRLRAAWNDARNSDPVLSPIIRLHMDEIAAKHHIETVQ